MLRERILGGELWPLFGFHVLVAVLLAIDLGIFQRRAHEIGAREAVAFSAFWIGLASLFCFYTLYRFGVASGLTWATAYVVEKSLSVDNLFVFVVIFSSRAVPPSARHRVLYWGVLGAILLRGSIIWAGTELLQRIHWLVYVFGAFLVFTGLKFLFSNDDEDGGGEGFLDRFVKKLVHTTEGYRGTRFFVLENGRRLATPLLATLVVVELSDVVFAVDSLPAVLALTSDLNTAPENERFFVAYTSNIFAILGLRALFFVVALGLEKFHYLKPALSFILVFVGAKMLAKDWLEAIEKWKVILGSLGVIVATLTIAGVASWAKARHLEAKHSGEAAPPAPAVPPPPS